MTDNVENAVELNQKLLKLLNSYNGKISHPEMMYLLMIYICESALAISPKEPLKLIEESAMNAMNVLKKMEIMK